MISCKRKSFEYEKFVHKVEYTSFFCVFFFFFLLPSEGILLGIPDSMNYSAIVNHGTSSARKTNVSSSQKGPPRKCIIRGETRHMHGEGGEEVIDLCCVSPAKNDIERTIAPG